MATALLGEQLIHGLDIARAANSPWSISCADALQVIAGVMAMAPDYVDRRQAAGLHVSYELRFRGGPRYRLMVQDGTAAITAPGQKVDCWIKDASVKVSEAVGALAGNLVVKETEYPRLESEVNAALGELSRARDAATARRWYRRRRPA